MNVKIGPYINWWGPYQFANLLIHVGLSKERCEKIGDCLANSWVGEFCQFVHGLRKRTIKVKLDPYDTWSMDSTLAHIIHPMLIQLKETKHGSPLTDDEDVPEHLRSTSAPPKEDEWDIDAFHHQRWDWILDEMIWAFSQQLIDWERQFHSGERDIVFKPIDDENNETTQEEAKFFEMITGPNDTHVFDKEGHQKHANRMQNGFHLFGKYYTALWD